MSKSSRKKGGISRQTTCINGAVRRYKEDRGTNARARNRCRLEPLTILAILVAVVTAAVYLLTLKNDFVNWDDGVYVVNNPHLRAFNGELFRWAFTAFYSSNWHPLTWISHALDLAVWGLNPFGHHLDNVVIHAVNSFLVVQLAGMLLGVVKGGRSEEAHFPADLEVLVAAGVTGFLFGLHPLHVESVAWVAERKDLLCALFFLLAMGSYLKYAEGADRNRGNYLFLQDKRYLATGFFFILALLSKPMAVSFPLVLLIIDWYPLNRAQFGRSFSYLVLEKLPLAALSLASAILTILAQRTKAMEMMEVVPFVTRLLVAAKTLVGYLVKMILPLNLTPYYPYPLNASLASPEYLLPLLLVIAVTITLIVTAGRRRPVLAVWGYYLVTLLPVIGIVQVGAQAMADRYTYLPSLGPFLLLGGVAAGMQAAVTRRGSASIARAALVAGGAVVAVGLTLATIGQIRIWKNSYELWSRVIALEPERVPFAYNNRAEVLALSGYMERALGDYDRAIALGNSLKSSSSGAVAVTLDRVVWEAHNNRGGIFAALGQVDKAIVEYDRALTLNPSLFQAYNNRGAALAKAGYLDRAVLDYEKAIALNGTFYEAYLNRSEANVRMGRFDQALADGEMAVKLNSGRADGYNQRGVVREKMGETEQALADFNQSIHVNPRFPDAYINRGNLSLKKGDKPQALADFHKACDLGSRQVCELLPTLEKAKP